MFKLRCKLFGPLLPLDSPRHPAQLPAHLAQGRGSLVAIFQHLYQREPGARHRQAQLGVGQGGGRDEVDLAVVALGLPALSELWDPAKPDVTSKRALDYERSRQLRALRLSRASRRIGVVQHDRFAPCQREVNDA
jgi:hypothetical protein